MARFSQFWPPLFLKASFHHLEQVLERNVDLRDIVFIAGLGLMAYGAAQIYVPSAWLLIGAVLVWVSLRRT